MATAPSSGARTSLSSPWNPPSGVRAAPTMTTGSSDKRAHPWQRWPADTAASREKARRSDLRHLGEQLLQLGSHGAAIVGQAMAENGPDRLDEGDEIFEIALGQRVMALE